MVGEPKISEVKQCQDLRRLKPLPGQRGVAGPTQPFAAPFAPSASVVQAPVLSCVFAAPPPRTPCPCSQSHSMRNRPNARADEIAGHYPTHCHIQRSRLVREPQNAILLLGPLNLSEQDSCNHRNNHVRLYSHEALCFPNTLVAWHPIRVT